MGGDDPYSASKAAAEILVNSFRKSFCGSVEHQKENLFIATARAGNAIGGGDWAEDRLLPDIARSIYKNKKIIIRNPSAVRPWQHVIEPLCGYLLLAENLFQEDKRYQEGFNFGPNENSSQTVLRLVQEVTKLWPADWELASNYKNYHEANFLTLDIQKARDLIQWEPRLTFSQTIAKTTLWYSRYFKDSSKTLEYCIDDLEKYLSSS